jgi:hypothetical protein
MKLLELFNEIAVVPKKYQVFQIPFESVPQDGGGSLMLWASNDNISRAYILT